MPNPAIPLIAYFEGAPVVGDTLYTYQSTFGLKILGYRLLSRDGESVEVGLYKNGDLLDTIEVTGTDSGDIELPFLMFNEDDILNIKCESAPVHPLNGLTFIFQAEITPSTDGEDLLNARRIQTPLIARYEGLLQESETFFLYKANQRMQLFGYTISLRNAADRQVKVDLLVNGAMNSQLLLTSGQTYGTGLISVGLESNSEVSFRISQAGTTDLGESMQILLDYRNLDQAEFSTFQTPFVLEYEGILTATSNQLLRYVLPRAITVAAAQLFIRDAVGVDLTVGLYRNGVIQTSVTLIAGNVRSTPVGLSIQFALGDEITAAVTSGSSSADALMLTLDYFVDIGDNAGAFVYYSDPQEELVLLARQVGIGGAKTDSLSFINMRKYQRDVDNVLNGRLRGIYHTPLRKLVDGGSNPWPGAIQSIAQRMVLHRLLNDIFSEIEPNASSNVEKNAQLAQEDLTQVINKEVWLDGQKLRSRNAGSNPYTEPMSIPQTLQQPPTIR